MGSANSTTTGFYSLIKSQNKYSNFSNFSNEHKSVFEFEVRSSSFEFSNELVEFVGALCTHKLIKDATIFGYSKVSRNAHHLHGGVTLKFFMNFFDQVNLYSTLTKFW